MKIADVVDRDIAAYLALKESRLREDKLYIERHTPLIDLSPGARELYERGKRRTAEREAEYNSEKQVAVRARAVAYSRKYRVEKKKRQSWRWRLARLLGVTHGPTRKKK